jgi:hypothetical protein
MIRYLLLVLSVCAGTYSVCSAIFGAWADAGINGVLAAVALIAAVFGELVHRNRQEQRERLRRHRQQVWDRREAQRWTLDERQPITTTVVYDHHGQPVAGYDTRGNNAAIWPSEAGAPE